MTNHYCSPTTQVGFFTLSNVSSLYKSIIHFTCNGLMMRSNKFAQELQKRRRSIFENSRSVKSGERQATVIEIIEETIFFPHNSSKTIKKIVLSSLCFFLLYLYKDSVKSLKIWVEKLLSKKLTFSKLRFSKFFASTHIRIAN